MNPDANQGTANGPAASPDPAANLAPNRPALPSGNATTASPNGLKAALKVAVPLVALVGVVFGITYLAQYTPPKDDTGKGDDIVNGGNPSGEPPLRFFTSSRRWDPPRLDEPGYRYLPLLAPSALAPEGSDGKSFSVQDRTFQGFYEHDTPTSPVRRTQFWFENRNPASVSMQLKQVSCMACSGGTMRVLPPEVTRNLLQHAALSSLPLGTFSGFGVGLAGPAAEIAQVPPTTYVFKDNPNATFHVPAATNPDKWSPQWGILELTFKVLAKADGPTKPLQAVFATQVEGTKQVGADTFVIAFEVAPPCAVSRSVIDVGKIDPLSGDREYKLLFYSATRGPGSEFDDLVLTPRNCLVQAAGGVVDPVKFVEVTKVERIPDTDLLDVSQWLAKEFGRQTKVQSAYNVTVVVRPKVGENRMDLGLLERTISLTAGDVTQQVFVKGTVRGAVWMDSDRNDIVLTTFSGAKGWTQQVELYTEKSGVEVVVVKDECKPANFNFTLEKQPDSGGQGHYKLKIAIPPNQVYGDVRGVVMLEVKGPSSQRLRIPFKGLSELR